MAKLRLNEDGSLVVYTRDDNVVGTVDMDDVVTVEAMRLALGHPVEFEHIDRPKKRWDGIRMEPQINSDDLEST